MACLLASGAESASRSAARSQAPTTAAPPDYSRRSLADIPDPDPSLATVAPHPVDLGSFCIVTG